MSALGVLHLGSGCAALRGGLVVLPMAKGTRGHTRVGWIYAGVDGDRQRHRLPHLRPVRSLRPLPYRRHPQPGCWALPRHPQTPEARLASHSCQLDERILRGSAGRRRFRNDNPPVPHAHGIGRYRSYGSRHPPRRHRHQDLGAESPGVDAE